MLGGLSSFRVASIRGFTVKRFVSLPTSMQDRLTMQFCKINSWDLTSYASAYSIWVVLSNFASAELKDCITQSLAFIIIDATQLKLHIATTADTQPESQQEGACGMDVESEQREVIVISDDEEKDTSNTCQPM